MPYAIDLILFEPARHVAYGMPVFTSTDAGLLHYMLMDHGEWGDNTTHWHAGYSADGAHMRLRCQLHTDEGPIYRNRLAPRLAHIEQPWALEDDGIRFELPAFWHVHRRAPAEPVTADSDNPKRKLKGKCLPCDGAIALDVSALPPACHHRLPGLFRSAAAEPARPAGTLAGARRTLIPAAPSTTDRRRVRQYRNPRNPVPQSAGSTGRHPVAHFKDPAGEHHGMNASHQPLVRVENLLRCWGKGAVESIALVISDSPMLLSLLQHNAGADDYMPLELYAELTFEPPGIELHGHFNRASGHRLRETLEASIGKQWRWLSPRRRRNPWYSGSASRVIIPAQRLWFAWDDAEPHPATAQDIQAFAKAWPPGRASATTNYSS